jgi:hypothetical protein
VPCLGLYGHKPEHFVPTVLGRPGLCQVFKEAARRVGRLQLCARRLQLWVCLICRTDGIALVRVSGEIDFNTAPRLSAAVNEALSEFGVAPPKARKLSHATTMGMSGSVDDRW